MEADIALLCERFAQLGVMAALVFGSQMAARRTQDRRLQREAQRVRTMLRVGLRGLRELYEENLRVLEGRDRPLISGRNQIALLRIQFGRLVSLEEEYEIEAVLGANIVMEAAEAAMAVTGKAAGPIAFTLPADADLGSVSDALLNACTAIEQAEALLRSPTESSPITAEASDRRFAAEVREARLAAGTAG